MIQKSFQIAYKEFSKVDELGAEQKTLIEAAIAIAHKSYSPYSNFPVGAALMLENGAIFTGNNQENIAFPSGTCAERSVLNYVRGNYPDLIIKTLAVTALHSNGDTPVTPCGFCRQVIVEMEQLQQHPIQIILHKPGGSTLVFDSAKQLLPLAFEDTYLKK